MRYRLMVFVLIAFASVQTQAMQQQSLLTTLTDDSSPDQRLTDQYSTPKVRATSQAQVLFSGYQVPNASRVNFAIPSGLYRQLCTGCLYDTHHLECHCQTANPDKMVWVKSALTVKDCQQISVAQTGELMCLDSSVKKS